MYNARWLIFNASNKNWVRFYNINTNITGHVK